MTPRQVEEILDNDQYFDWGNFEYNKEPRQITVTQTLDVELVDSKFGEEGDWATSTYVVVKIGDQYFRKTGYYRSHDGEYWDGTLEEVTPVEKTITTWKEM